MASASESQSKIQYLSSYMRGLAVIILILDTEQKLFSDSYISQHKDIIIEKVKEAGYINTSETRLKQAIQKIQKNFKATRAQKTSDQSQSSLNTYITAKEEKYFGKISLETRIHLRWLYQVLNEEDHTHLEYWACQPEYAVSLQELQLYFRYLKYCGVPVYRGLTTDARLKLQGLLRGVPGGGKKMHQVWAKRVGVEDVEKVSEYIRHLQNVMNIKIQRQSPSRDRTTPETSRSHCKTPTPVQAEPSVAASSVRSDNHSRTSLPPTSIARSVAEPQPAERGSRRESPGQYILIESRSKTSDLLDIPRKPGTEPEETSDSHSKPVSATNRPINSADSSVQQTPPSALPIRDSVEASIPMTSNPSKTPSTSDAVKSPSRDTAPTFESVVSSPVTPVDRETQVSEVEVRTATTHAARDTDVEAVNKEKAASTQLTNAKDDRSKAPSVPKDSFILLGNHPLHRGDESTRPIRLAAIRTTRARRLRGRTSTSAISTPLTVVVGSPSPRISTLAVDKNDAQTTVPVDRDAHDVQHRATSRNTTGEVLWTQRGATESAHNTSSHQPPVTTLVDDDIVMAEDEDEDFDGMLEYPKNESEGTSEMEIDELDSDDEQETSRLTRTQLFNPINPIRGSNRPKSAHPPGLGTEPHSQDMDSTSEARKVFNAGLTIPSSR